MSLLAQTKQNGNSTKLNRAKRRRSSPIPKLSEQQFLGIKNSSPRQNRERKGLAFRHSAATSGVLLRVDSSKNLVLSERKGEGKLPELPFF